MYYLSFFFLTSQNGNTCISGGRDRTLSISKLSSENIETSSEPNAHNGWIWGLTAIHDTIYSCSWDGTAKAWKINSDGLIPLTTYEM